MSFQVVPVMDTKEMRNEPGTSSSTKAALKAEDVYALHLWPSAPLLAQYIYYRREDFVGKTVLELGSGGTSVTGIVASKCGAAHVIFTDKSTHVEVITNRHDPYLMNDWKAVYRHWNYVEEIANKTG